jgi:nitroreductase
MMSEQGGGLSAWDAIASRRDVREFAGRPVGEAELEQILEAGRRSPSSRNTQPWDFVVVTDRQQLTELAKAASGGGGPAPPAVIVALVGPGGDRRQRTLYDLGQVTMSMMLAATGLGIGSGHASVTDQDLARRVLGYPEGLACSFLITLGYPAGRPLAPIRHPDRRPLGDIVHRGHW